MPKVSYTSASTGELLDMNYRRRRSDAVPSVEFPDGSSIDTRDGSVVLFDGVCNLCNGFVDWLVRHDTNGQFQLASLQGQTGQRLCPDLLESNESEWSIILIERGGRYFRSDAVLRIVSSLNWVFRAARVFLLVPRPLRDLVYRWVARNRYRWFGKRETCRIPTADERSRVLTKPGRWSRHRQPSTTCRGRRAIPGGTGRRIGESLAVKSQVDF